MAGSWWHSVSRLLWSSSVAAACWHPGGENIFIWWNIFDGSCLESLDAGWWSQKSWWWCLQLQSRTMTALENAGALASWILETHLGLGQTSAGAEVEDIFIRSHWYVMKKAFCLGWCLAVLCKNILFIECLVPWCGQQQWQLHNYAPHSMTQQFFTFNFIISIALESSVPLSVTSRY